MKQYNKLFLLLFLLLFNKTNAQNSSFVTYGLEDGLVMSQIETMVQDPKGYVWIGTIAGLSKYDGFKFTNYTQKNGLAEDWITASAVDQEGNVWFGHWGGGVTCYNTKQDSFIDLKLEKYSKFKLISSICVVNDQIWFATDGAGIFKHNVKENTTIRIDEQLPSLNVSSLALDDQKNLWIGTEQGLVILNPNKGPKGEIIKKYDVSNGLPTNSIQFICKTYANEMWLATSYAGILRIKINPSYNISFSNPAQFDVINKEDGLTSDNIKTLFFDHQNSVWIGTKEQGIIQYMPSSNKSNNLAQGELNIFTNKFEMKYYHANAFLEDREGNIWVGTEIGLNKYMGDIFRVYNHNDNLVNNLVWSILQSRNGKLWFGTTDGISIFSFPRIGKKVQYNSPSAQNITTQTGLSENIIISLFEDKQNRIWAGTENAGVNIIVGEKVVKQLSMADGLPDNKIFSINEDKDGYIWIGTRKGVAKVNPASFEMTIYNSENGMGGDKVYHIFKDSKGNMWFGILGGSLTKYDGTKFKVYEEGDGLNQKFILSIVEDKQGKIWLGTYGDGIISYDGNTFKIYNTNQGLSSNSTHFLTCDNDNNIWIGQSLGIEKFNQKENKFSLYGKQQGFNGLETNENAVYKDAQGNIWFGTLRGAIKFDPRKDKINKVEPLTYIEKFKIYFQDQPLPENASFSYKQNYLTFQVLGISLTNPKEVRYTYLLEGFDTEWSPETKSNNITYSNLPPGSYTFRVKSVNNSGIQNTKDTSFSFVITPPFWKTWWFYTLCSIAIVAIIFTYIKQRERKLKERQEYLEQEVKKRTQELQKEKEVVEKQNTEITKKNKDITESISYAKRIQEAILPPFDLIKKKLPQSFILYQPKDIVSGDFYWIQDTDDKLLFAVVDCTGHGVPGAFMSIIGHNLLDKVVKEYNITQPAAILDKLSIELAKTLRQEENSEVKDGMDIAICAIDKNKNILEFCGAYNPLYLVRNNEIIELKSNKIPIGKGNSNIQSGLFQNQEVPLQPNDMLYIFSDGYADQKGGPNHKKFYYPPFRDLLLKIHEQPLEKQKVELQETITQWRGDLEQYDDMLIMGVKI